ncbi:hypothetical protein GOC53_19780 [Sinorhizobium medicae]|nr:hypothetical protein [Sinorhizobium meliloti]MDX0492498.1 hypothetical protein [Sinorhizobium medicae]
MRQGRRAAKPGRGERGQGRKRLLTKWQEIAVGLRFIKRQQQAIGALARKAVDEAHASEPVRAAKTGLRTFGLGEDRRDDYRFEMEDHLGLPADPRVISGTRSIPLQYPLYRRFRQNYGRDDLAIEIAAEVTSDYGKPVSARHVKTCSTKARLWQSKYATRLRDKKGPI